jgi:hypothetical protein
MAWSGAVSPPSNSARHGRGGATRICAGARGCCAPDEALTILAAAPMAPMARPTMPGAIVDAARRARRACRLRRERALREFDSATALEAAEICAHRSDRHERRGLLIGIKLRQAVRGPWAARML